nr:immunoglobulin light chain junction region [Macaca mulatta]MOW61282.1 immunoglobulin light chain junction region [Macaca mulatta]MOW61447.1 immunoglobulin light chain junction region [Macaca mulatta]
DYYCATWDNSLTCPLF